MAAATMPPSRDRRVEAARQAVLLLQAVGDAEHAAEIADVLAERRARSGSRASITSSAELSAWIMFIVAMVRLPICWRWRRRCPGISLKTSSNMVVDAGQLVLAERAVALGLLVRGASPARPLPCARPGAGPRSIRPSAIRCCFSRSTGSPSGQALAFVGRAVAAGIVARGMAFGAIGEVLDQRRRRDWRARAPPPIASPRRRRGSRCRRRAAPAGRSRCRAPRRSPRRRRRCRGSSRSPTDC